MKPLEDWRNAVDQTVRHQSAMPGCGPIKAVYGIDGQVFAVRGVGFKDRLFVLNDDGSWLEVVKQ